MEPYALRGVKRRSGEHTARAIRALPFALLEALLIAQHQVYVHDILAMGPQQRSKTRAHSRRVEYDASPLLGCAFEAAMQFAEHALTAAPLVVRERLAHGIRAEMHGTVMRS